MLDALSPGVPLPLRPDSPPRRAPAPGEGAHSGFPSPADDYVESRIDLNLELIPRPLSTFFMRVSGDAMRGDGIHDGDLLVIDRSVQARTGMVVVAVCGGTFLLRRLLQRDGAAWLVASDGASPPIRLAPPGEAGGSVEAEGELWGVVLHAVHHLLPPRRIGAAFSSGGG